MIDFHCHIDLYPNPKEVLVKAGAKGVYILAVTTTPKAWEGNQILMAECQRVRIALGLHPELVAERHSEVQRLIQLLPQTKYVGEVGLDGGPQHRTSFKLQELVLSRILRACSDNGGRIISLHSRGATNGVLDALESEPNAGIPVLHWFSGTQQQLDRAVNMGCWFSVGPQMLKTRKGKALVEAMPQDRLLTETDAPFSQNAGLPLMPWDVQYAVLALAELWGIEPVDVDAQLKLNLRALTNK